LETSPIWALVGVVIGAIVAIAAPLVTEHMREKREKISHFNALLFEIERNAHIFRITKKEQLPLDYLHTISSSAYEKAKEKGFLSDLPSSVREKLIGTYEKASAHTALIGREVRLPKMKQLLADLEKIPTEFESLYNLLSQHLKRKSGYYGLFGSLGFLGFLAFLYHNPWILFLFCLLGLFGQFKYFKRRLRYLGALAIVGLVLGILAIVNMLKV